MFNELPEPTVRIPFVLMLTAPQLAGSAEATVFDTSTVLPELMFKFPVLPNPLTMIAGVPFAGNPFVSIVKPLAAMFSVAPPRTFTVPMLVAAMGAV